MAASFLDELRKEAKTPEQVAAEKRAEETHRHEEHVNYHVEKAYRNIKDGLMQAATDGRRTVDKNGQVIISYDSVLSSVRPVFMNSVATLSDRVKNEFCASAVVSEKKGDGFLYSCFDKKYKVTFSLELMAHQVYDRVAKMAEAEQIKCSFVTYVVYRHKEGGRRTEEYPAKSLMLKTKWNEDVTINLIIRAEAQI